MKKKSKPKTAKISFDTGSDEFPSNYVTTFRMTAFINDAGKIEVMMEDTRLLDVWEEWLRRNKNVNLKGKSLSKPKRKR